jgi:hypothetical protein
VAIISKNIITVKQLLELSLIIPPYQRPYKWQAHNVNQLIEDVMLHRNKSRYRLGTVVLHQETASELSIVDGQQRLLTLAMLYSLLDKNSIITPAIFSHSFQSNTSVTNLKHNAAVINSRLNQLSESVREELVDFILHKCEVISIRLDDLSEAFQFFDSQNARGKELAPYDLLKAFHLREMETNTQAERIECVANWEQEVSPNKNLAVNLETIMSDYLFRVRRWCKGESGAYFSRHTIGEFKGVNLSSTPYRFTMPLRALDYMVAQYNEDNVRKWDIQHMEYPFQIDQTMLNGKRFFEYIHYYINVYQTLFLQESDALHHLIATIDSYEGKSRVGDHYVRNLFYCAVLHYYDKFGDIELENAAELCFVWSYQIRLKQHRVPLESIDNHAKDKGSLFSVISNALHPHDVLTMVVKPVKKSEIKGTKIDGLANKFKALRYLTND